MDNLPQDPYDGSPALCPEERLTAGGWRFICLREPHPDDPDRHVLARDGVGEELSTRSVDLESSLESYFRKRVRLAGGHPVKITSPAERGVPDRLVIMPGGHIYLVELKTVDGRVSPIQRVWHAKMALLGVQVFVLSGREDVDRWLAGTYPKSQVWDYV